MSKRKYKPAEEMPAGRGFNEFGPGSFATHEAVHMTGFLGRAFNEEVRQHRAVIANPKWALQAQKIYAAMFKLHRSMIEEWKP